MSDAMYSAIKAAQQGDRELAGRLVEENSGLIWSIVRRFFGRGVDADDLYQLGCVGFLKAIEGFDESFGTKFSTYAVPKISGEIRRFLRDDGTVKVSRSIKEQANLIRNARTQLEQRLGREPLLSELSKETGVSPEEIAFAETATGPAESLHRESGEDGFTLELSQEAAEREAGIKKTSFHKYVNLMIEKGYLVQRGDGSNLYDFYERPQEQKKKAAAPAGELVSLRGENAEENNNPSDELLRLLDESEDLRGDSVSSQRSKEIYNKGDTSQNKKINTDDVFVF